MLKIWSCTHESSTCAKIKIEEENMWPVIDNLWNASNMRWFHNFIIDLPGQFWILRKSVLTLRKTSQTRHILWTLGLKESYILLKYELHNKFKHSNWKNIHKEK